MSDVENYLMRIASRNTPFILSHLQRHIPQLNKRTQLSIVRSYDRVEIPIIDDKPVRPQYDDEIRYIPAPGMRARLWRVWIALFSEHYENATPTDKGWSISVKRTPRVIAPSIRTKTLEMQRYRIVDFGEELASVIVAYDGETDTLYVRED